MNLRGRVVLITAASSGISAATTQEMTRKGAKVFLRVRRKEGIEQIADEIKAQNGLAKAYAVDLGDAQAVEKTAQEIRSEFGDPDVLINNAGGAGRFLYKVGARNAVHRGPSECTLLNPHGTHIAS